MALVNKLSVLIPMSFPFLAVTPRHLGLGGRNTLFRRRLFFRTVVMPLPEGDIDLSVDSCLKRVEAIPIDVFGLYIYHDLKNQAFVSLTKKQSTTQDLIDRARRADNQSFVRSMEEFELPAKVRVGSAIEMVSIVFHTVTEDFVKRHQQILNLIEKSDRIETRQDSLSFFENDTQIQHIPKSSNVELYKNLFTISHPYDTSIDSKVGEFTSSNELVKHFEKTRTRAFFREHGASLKSALIGVLRWVDSKIAHTSS